MVNISTGKLRHRSTSLSESTLFQPRLAVHTSLQLQSVGTGRRAVGKPLVISPRHYFLGLLLLCYCKFNAHTSFKNQDCQVKAWSSLGEAFCGYAFCNSTKLREQIALVTEMFALSVLQ